MCACVCACILHACQHFSVYTYALSCDMIAYTCSKCWTRLGEVKVRDVGLVIIVAVLLVPTPQPTQSKPGKHERVNSARLLPESSCSADNKRQSQEKKVIQRKKTTGWPYCKEKKVLVKNI